MANSTTLSQTPLPQDQEIWQNLKQAISNSSGFRCWQAEQNNNSKLNLEEQVSLYLQETLKTLAY